MSANILVVDDDCSTSEMVVHVMSRPGYDITAADSLQQAMEALQQRNYDLVISDLLLPDGSGLQLLTEVRKNHPRTHTILLTGFPDVATVQSALRAGAFDYLIKPVIPSKLAHIADLAMEHRRFEQEREMLRNRLEAVFQGVDDAIIALDHTWCIIQINHAAAQLLRLSPSSINQPLQDQVAWIFPMLEPLLQQARQRGEGNRTVRRIVMDDDGKEKILSCTASLFHDPLHNSYGVILIVRDESRLAMLERETKTRQGWHGLVGSSQPMQEIYTLIEQLAEFNSTVLITGETGTGKELVARSLHTTSTRHHRSFVAVNCGALPDGLLESELFGHVRGAFTNAIRDKPGRFKLADGGTIFLDEIGDLSLAMQVRLLRVLQEQVFEAVGDNRPIHVDVRVVTATHQNLLKLVHDGLFREDLYYRIKVVEVHLPPLREHRTDLPMLVDHFLTRFNTRMNRSVKGVSGEVMAALMEYDWPGNIRELEHTLEHAMVVAQKPLLILLDLPNDFRVRAAAARPTLGQSVATPTADHRGRPLRSGHPAGTGPDREAILAALEASRWQIQATATELGISRSTLWRRMKSMGL
ncbi:MAG: sigma 54-interacting transcriptional regulator [Magnetococcales bacterium]|nr:sigma 54-interacting transcriptional regulator [Magnetococcales bacterium]